MNEISTLALVVGLWLLTGCAHQPGSSSNLKSFEGPNENLVMEDPSPVGNLVGECSLEIFVEAVRFRSPDDDYQSVGAIIGGSAVSVFIPLSRVSQTVEELADLIPPLPVVVDETMEIYRVEYSAKRGITVKRDYSGYIAVNVRLGEPGVWYCNGQQLRRFRDLLAKVEEALSR